LLPLTSRCFTAAEGIEWLLDHGYAVTIAEALALGRAMQRNDIIQPGEPSKFDLRGRGRSSGRGAPRRGDREDGWGDDLGRRWHFVESLEGDGNAEGPLGTSGAIPGRAGAERSGKAGQSASGDKSEKSADRANNSLFSKWSSRRARERVEREKEKEREHKQNKTESARASSPRAAGEGGSPRTPRKMKSSTTSSAEPTSSTPSPDGGGSVDRGEAEDAAPRDGGGAGVNGERDAARRYAALDDERTPTPLGSPPIPRRRAPTSEIFVYLDDIADADDGMAVEEDAVSYLLCTVTFYANLAHSLTRSP